MLSKSEMLAGSLSQIYLFSDLKSLSMFAFHQFWRSSSIANSNCPRKGDREDGLLLRRREATNEIRINRCCKHRSMVRTTHNG